MLISKCNYIIVYIYIWVSISDNLPRLSKDFANPQRSSCGFVLLPKRPETYSLPTPVTCISSANVTFLDGLTTVSPPKMMLMHADKL